MYSSAAGGTDTILFEDVIIVVYYGSSARIVAKSVIYHFLVVTVARYFLARHDTCMSRLCYEHDVQSLSICLSVTLVTLWSYSATKVEFGTCRIGWCLGYLHAKANPDRNLTRDPLFCWWRQMGYGKNVEFCTSAAIISASNGSHVALSQHLPSFLFCISGCFNWTAWRRYFEFLERRPTIERAADQASRELAMKTSLATLLTTMYRPQRNDAWRWTRRYTV